MAVITHPRVDFTGIEVIRCREYDFRDGTATADVDESERAVLTVKGYRVDADEKPAKTDRKRDKAKRAEPKQETPDPEIGADVEITEEAPPEIG